MNNLKFKLMISKRLNLSDSIYQRKGSKEGLTQKDGMLLNNRPDGVTGIRQMVELKKSVKRAEKISTYAQAVMIGSRMEDMSEGGCCD